MPGIPALCFRLHACRPQSASRWLLQLLVLLALGSLWTAGTALAGQDATLERAFWRDDSGQSDFEHARKQTFTPYSGLLTEGYQRQAAYWLRVKVRAGDPDSPPYVMRLRPFWHDQFTLFDPADMGPAARVGGDRYDWSTKEFAALNHAFLIRKTAEDREVFLRLKSVHTYLLDIQILEQGQAQRVEWRNLVLYLIYLGLLMVVSAWAVVSLIARPERVIAAFAAYLVVMVAYCFSLLGLGHMLLDGIVPSRTLDAATSLIVIICTAAGVNFHRVLLQEYTLRRPIARLLDILVVVPVLLLVLMLAGEPTRALMINAHALLLSSALIFFVSWTGIKQSQAAQAVMLPIWTVKGFYTLLLLVSLLGALPLIGWNEATEISLHIFLAYGILVTVVMGLLLYHRAQKSREQQIEQLAIARQKAEQAQRARLEQNQFMSMLNHELKTPMSVLKLLVAGQPIQAQAETHIDTMDSLLERCLLSDRLESQASGLRRRVFSPAQALRDCVDKTRAPERFVLDASTQQTLGNDPDLFGVITSNLLDNALRYAAPHTPITVTLGPATVRGREGVCLRVRNAIGRAGVPDPARVFDKYYRAEAAKSVPGTGLGLYLVKSFVELMDGEVSCFTDSTHIWFDLCLPR